MFCIQCGHALRDVAVVAGPPICGSCVRFNHRRIPLSPPSPHFCAQCGDVAELVDGAYCAHCAGGIKHG